jgi:hypothetical protein
MTHFLIVLLTIECALIFAWGLKQRERYLQFPILAAAVFLGWLMPQFLGLTKWAWQPPGALDKTILMAIFCLGATYWGYIQNKQPAQLFRWTFNRRKLLQGSAVLSLLGGVFFFKVSQLAAEANAMYGGAWSGIITIYVFFSHMLSVGFATALILHLRRPSPGTWLILGFGCLFYIHRVIIAGRRAAMAELFLMVLLAVWFNRRWAPPRLAIIGAFIAGALVINSIGAYRDTMLGDDRATWSGAGLKEIASIDFGGNLARIAEGEAGMEEVRNAVLTIEAVDRQSSFDYGFSIWNEFVHQYIPGQLIGAHLKSAMKINLRDPAYEVFGHTPYFGTTYTGLADSFSSFWFIGAAKFFLIGFLLNRWYRAANEGNFAAQLVIMLSMSPALHAITHTTHHFFLNFIQLASFAIPVLIYARVMRRSNQVVRTQRFKTYRPVMLSNCEIKHAKNIPPHG